MSLVLPVSLLNNRVYTQPALYVGYTIDEVYTRDPRRDVHLEKSNKEQSIHNFLPAVNINVLGLFQ